MAWIQHGEIWPDDGNPGADEQLGKAASVRFVNPDLPGCRVTVYAYPHAPEKENTTREGSVETFHGFMADMDSFGIQAQTWFEIDEDADGDADEWEPGWSEIRYQSLDTRPYSGLDEKMIADAETDALAWVTRFDANRDIHWDGKRF
jgi:hypothetical protein